MIWGCLCSFWCFKLCSWLLLPLSWVSTQEAMGYGYLTKRQLFSKETGLHIALQWNEVREADVSCEECCRTKWCRTCEHVSTDLYWLNSNASRACDFCDPLLSFFTGAGEVSATSSSSCGSSSSVASEWVGMHAFHRNQTVLKISKNALKISKAGISKEPTWTNSDISMHGQTLTVLGTCSGNFLCLYCYLVCQVPAACAMRHSIDHFKIFQAT